MPLPIGMPNSSCTLGDAARRLVGDDLEVIGLAADDRAQRDQRVEVAGLREPLQRERRLQRARHGDDGDVALGDAGLLQRAQRAREQPSPIAGLKRDSTMPTRRPSPLRVRRNAA